jgi:hypothetical protein
MVSIEYGSGFVPADLHSYLLIHTGLHQILDSRPVQIVNDEPSISWVRFAFNLDELSKFGSDTCLVPFLT